ncbi:MAG: BMP family protein [Firmicutes bacterium]|nr:BMP family protein [Bacillota bacterium]
MMKKGLLLVLAIFAAFVLVGCGNTAEKKEDLKVALALTGSKTDGGWNQTAYEGLVQIEDKLGATVVYSENVTASDYERVLRDYAKDGNTVVIGHGYEFSDAAIAVGAEYPDTYFIVTSSSVTNDKNVGSLNNNYLQAGFMQGVFAAMMTSSNVVAGVGGGQIPPIVDDLAGFVAGAKYINPDIKALTAITGSFDDANKAKEQALAFVNQGADVLMVDADAGGRGVYVAAEEKGLFAIGSIAAEYDQYSKSLISCATADMATAIYSTVKEIADGTYTAQFELKGVKEGIVDFTYSPTLDSKIPQAVKDKITEVKEKLASGEIDVTKLIAE